MTQKTTILDNDDTTYNAENTIDMTEEGGVFVSERLEEAVKEKDFARKDTARRAGALLAANATWNATKYAGGLNVIFEGIRHLPVKGFIANAATAAPHVMIGAGIIAAASFLTSYAVAYTNLKNKHNEIEAEFAVNNASNDEAPMPQFGRVLYKIRVFGLAAGLLTACCVMKMHDELFVQDDMLEKKTSPAPEKKSTVSVTYTLNS